MLTVEFFCYQTMDACWRCCSQ